MARYVPKVDYGRLEFEYVPSSGFYRARIPTDNSFKKDTDYAVVFDGRRYTVRSTANGAIGGNAYLYDQRKPDTGEPFYLAPAMGLVMASTAGFHSVSYGIMKADGNNVDERLDGLEKVVDSLSEEIEGIKASGGGSGGGFVDYYPQGPYLYHDTNYSTKVTRDDVLSDMSNKMIRVADSYGEFFEFLVRIVDYEDYMGVFIVIPGSGNQALLSEYYTAEWSNSEPG